MIQCELEQLLEWLENSMYAEYEDVDEKNLNLQLTWHSEGIFSEEI